MSWIEFCTDNGISYSTPNENNIRVKCPFCGSSDTSKNLSLSTKSPYWLCWRDKDNHKGKAPLRAIAALLQIDEAAAETLVRKYFPDWQNFSSKIIDKKRAEIKPIEPLKEFNKFGQASSYKKLIEQKFRNYLVKRKFDPDYLTSRYDLRFAETGAYAERIIIPSILNGAWHTWTARALKSDVSLRYKSCDESEVKPDQLVFDVDNLYGGDVLIIAEGFFDAARITSAMVPNVSCVPLMGKGISDLQLHQFMMLCKLYERTVLILDEDAYSTQLQYWSTLSWYLPLRIRMMRGDKDFGDFTPTAVKTEIYDILKTA